MTRRGGHRRGFTVIEVLIALGLAAVASAFLLMIARSQLLSYEQNDQVVKAQQNGRAALNYLEQLTRRACGGISRGNVGINVPGVTPSVVTCVNVVDGAVQSAGGFAAGTATNKADALEVIYGTAPVTVTSAAPTLGGAASVADVTGFAVGDFVLLGDMSQAVLMQISQITNGTAPAGTLTFATPGGSVVQPTGLVFQANTNVMKAVAFSVYVETNLLSPYANMLMYDPDGPAGNTHTDARPLAEGVEDLQIAVGIDTSGDGIIQETGNGTGDEWIGNALNELPLQPAPWSIYPTRLLRLTLLTKTTNSYLGSTPAVGPYEDRTVYPATTSPSPRFRVARVSVAPRTWNLTN